MSDDDERKKKARRAALAALFLFLLPKRTGHDALGPADFVAFDRADDALRWAKRHKFAAVVARGSTGPDFLRRLHAAHFVVPIVLVGSNVEAMRHATADLSNVHYLHDSASEAELLHTVHQSVVERETLARLRGEPAGATLAGGSSGSNLTRYGVLVAALLVALALAVPHFFGGGGDSPTPHRGFNAGASGGSTPSSASAAPSAEVPSGTFASSMPTMTTPSPGPSNPETTSPEPSNSNATSPQPLPSDASLVVLDGKGNPVVSQNGGIARTPASTLKLVVAAAANNILGAHFRFTTTIGSTTAPQHGDPQSVTIESDGDPTLTSADLVAAARQLYKEGVRNVGDIDVVTAPFAGPEQNPQWSAQDKTQPYGAGSSAVTLDGNLVDNAPVVGIPTFVGNALKRDLSAAGIAVSGNVAAVSSAPLGWTGWTHQSQPLPEIARRMLFESNNLYAEQLLRRVGVARFGTGSVETGTRAETEFLQSLGVPTDGINLVDGSGLSKSNRITAATLAALLSRLPPDQAAALYNELPVLGEQGTLATRLQEKRAHAKDGRLDDVDALAGYVDTASHGRAAFVFIINRPNLSRAQTHDFGDSVAAALAKY